MRTTRSSPSQFVTRFYRDVEALGLRGVMWLFLIAWTVVVAASMGWSYAQQYRETMESARTEARTAYEKDIFYRRWNAEMGGVYVPVTLAVRPNPYLSMVKNRDIISRDGIYTLINPAYMTRMVHEIQAQAEGVLGHITSLDPLRPANAADLWERDALQAFEEGAEEVSSLEVINGTDYLRLMRPLYVEESCMKCHAQQGYQIGDVRGGISVSIPIEGTMKRLRQRLAQAGVAHFGLWFFGALGISLLFSAVEEQMKKRIQAEAQLLETQKRADMGVLAAGVAHGLNSPLQVITGVSESLIHRLEEDEQIGSAEMVEKLQTINRNGWRSAQSIQSLLRFSFPSLEDMALNDINKIIEDALLLIEKPLELVHDIHLVRDLAPDLPLFQCSHSQITEVLVHLINNARDAMPVGGNIYLQTRYDRNTSRLILRVRDEGEGIAEENLIRIFKPFFTTRQTGKGLGLGLSIVQSIVQTHGGEIEVLSTVKVGTTFTISFPVEGGMVSDSGGPEEEEGEGV